MDILLKLNYNKDQGTRHIIAVSLNVVLVSALFWSNSIVLNDAKTRLMNKEAFDQT